jgi:hypothetical protein
MQTDSVLHKKKGNRFTKQKGKERIGEWHLTASGEMGKENAETKTIMITGPTIMDKPTHKIPIKPKVKEMAKNSKEKGRAKKGKPRYGDRKKDDKNHQENETKPVTNNLRKVYLEEQYRLGDDETTIVFTQNATRIITSIEKDDDENENEIIDNENNETREYERISLELAPIFEGMIKAIMNLPDE